MKNFRIIHRYFDRTEKAEAYLAELCEANYHATCIAWPLFCEQGVYTFRTAEKA